MTKAWNGLEAVEIFEKSRPGEFDVILMDIMMPFMNGYNATKRIRSMDREDAKEIPIIAMVRPRTGGFCYTHLEIEAMKRDTYALLQAGADGIAVGILKENGIVKTGDIAVVTAGVVDYAKRHEPAASTNIMRVVNID